MSRQNICKYKYIAVLFLGKNPYILSVIMLNKIIKSILSVLLITAVIIVPRGLYKSLNTDKITDEIYRRREKYFYGVINVWQIDSFEGGKGSRANFLNEISKRFEKKNNGVYISVETITVEKAEKLISSGQKRPDIISYGSGVNLDESLFMKLNLNNIPTAIKKAYTEKAVPWCMGAYFMIGDSNKEKWGQDGYLKQTKKGETKIYSIGVPKREGHTALRNINIGENGLFEATSQEIFEAYNYSQKVIRMIGTQRDLYRLQGLEEKEKAREGDITFLGYTDLFQYVSILNCDNLKKKEMMDKYINFLLETEQQNELGEIGLFPVMTEAEPQYTNSYVADGWKKIQKDGIIEFY